jgi:hypothetical protein
MTRFNHAQRSGRRKRPKQRDRKPMGIRDLEALHAHRELEWLRHPTPERWRKLQEVRRWLA